MSAAEFLPAAKAALPAAGYSSFKETIKALMALPAAAGVGGQEAAAQLAKRRAQLLGKIDGLFAGHPDLQASLVGPMLPKGFRAELAAIQAARAPARPVGPAQGAARAPAAPVGPPAVGERRPRPTLEYEAGGTTAAANGNPNPNPNPNPDPNPKP
jgi:hypothetical protein